MFLWLLTLYLKVEPMAPFLFLHHYMDATRNPGCFSEKRQPQKLISKKRVAFPSEHITAPWFFAGRRAGVPLWPVVCPVPQGGGEVKSWRRVVDRKGDERGQPRSGAEVAVANGNGRRSTLYFTERPAAPAPAGRK